MDENQDYLGSRPRDVFGQQLAWTFDTLLFARLGLLVGRVGRALLGFDLASILGLCL